MNKTIKKCMVFSLSLFVLIQMLATSTQVVKAFDEDEFISLSDLSFNNGISLQSNQVSERSSFTKTISEPVNITLTQDDVGTGSYPRLYALQEEGEDWENWTYIFNAPVNIVVDSVTAYSFSLIRTEEFDKYIFNAPVTVTVKNSNIQYLSGTRYFNAVLSIYGTETHMTTEVNSTYTLNIEGGVYQNVSPGILKTSTLTFPAYPTEEFKATFNDSVYVNISDGATINSLSGSHFITTNILDSSKNVEFSVTGDVNVTVNNSTVASLVPNRSHDVDVIRDFSVVNGDFNVDIINGGIVEELYVNEILEDGSTHLAGNVTGYSTLKTTSSNISHLVGVDEVILNNTLNITEKFITPSTNMKVNLSNLDSWQNAEDVIHYTFASVDDVGEDNVYSGWSDSSKVLEYNETGTTKIWSFGLGDLSESFIDINVGPNGSVTPMDEYEDNTNTNPGKWVINGNDLELNFTPDLGYKINTVKLDGETVIPTDLKYNLVNVTQNHVMDITFEPISYLIYFDANMGVGEMESQSFLYNIEQNLTSNTYNKENAVFIEWNTKADGTGTTYSDEQSILNLFDTDLSEMVLFAQWETNSSADQTTPETGHSSNQWIFINLCLLSLALLSTTIQINKKSTL